MKLSHYDSSLKDYIILLIHFQSLKSINKFSYNLIYSLKHLIYFQNLRKKCKNGITITDMAIINQSSASQPPRTLPKNLYASVPGPSKPYDPMSFTPSFENFGSTKDTSDTSNSENEDEYVPRDKKPNPYVKQFSYFICHIIKKVQKEHF